jgi:hypothetical protein
MKKIKKIFGEKQAVYLVSNTLKMLSPPPPPRVIVPIPLYLIISLCFFFLLFSFEEVVIVDKGTGKFDIMTHGNF